MSLLFLGVGNLHRSDDGVGPLLAGRLSARDDLRALGVDVLDHGGEGASLMSLWEGLDKVIAVDAMKSHRTAGLIETFDPHNQTIAGGVFRYSSHLFGLAEAVEMSRALDTLPKEMIIFGIEGGCFDFGAPMTAAVEEAMLDVERQVLAAFGL